MAIKRMTVQKYIKTILDQLPTYIESYQTKDRELLQKFLSPLKSFDEASYSRPDLSKKFSSSRQWIISQNNFLELPFSWFVDTFFDNAEITLHVSSFHADQFYDYILTILKGSNNDGVFHLLRNNVPLDALEWEALQYKSAKLRVPLKSYQLQILRTIYEFIKIHPLDVYKANRLQYYILSQNDIPRLSSKLSKLFTILHSRWSIWPEFSSFDIATFFFKFTISTKTALQGIIDFIDPKNHILTTSIVYSRRDNNREFIGVLTLPKGSQKDMIAYLNEKKPSLEKYELFPIIENRWSYSLSQYRTDTGWQELPNSTWNQITNILLSSRYRKRKDTSLDYLSPPKTTNWSIEQLTEPFQAISLICKPNDYSYDDLRIRNYTNQEMQLLKELINHNAILTDFFNYRLRLEYSLDSYWIEAPVISMYQLTRLLNLLPYARIARTKERIFIHTFLTPILKQRISDDLGWQIYQLLPVHVSGRRDIKMYDEEKQRWKKPEIFNF